MRFLKISSALFILMCTAPLWSQTGTSTIRGLITDPEGRVVVGASVILTNVATNAARATQSNDIGVYVFDLITPADYRIEVEARGFRTKIVNNVEALIGKQTETNIKLDVGAANEIVEVRASAQEALINTQDASLGNV
ncbi:MAG: carboxypeptidase-like regulatory domain-containing protein, partial [Burkholderiales bacterium]